MGSKQTLIFKFSLILLFLIQSLRKTFVSKYNPPKEQSDLLKLIERDITMYKNQLHELAQRSCFNLPSYACLRDGPDHSPRFKSTVSFNGESFQCHGFFPTLRQAEHSAAEAALLSLSSRSLSLASRIRDETGVYKNLLQEISQRVGAPLPQYTTFRSGLGHQPVFTGTVELTGIIFTGEPAKNKKQAEKNAAMAAWSCLKQLVKELDGSSEPEKKDELEQVTIARALLYYKSKEKFAFGGGSSSKILFPKLLSQNPRPSSPLPPSATSSKILPLICPKTSNRLQSYSPAKDNVMPPMPPQRYTPTPKFLDSGASPYIPIEQFRAASCRGLAPPVTVRTAVPVYAAPPTPRPPSTRISSPLVWIAPPGCIKPEVPAVVDNLLLRIHQQESTPAIAPLPLVNNLRELVVAPPRSVTPHNLLHMQKREAAPVIAPSSQHAVQVVSPFKGLQESEVALLTQSSEQINT